jgi:hypothetical protein
MKQELDRLGEFGLLAELEANGALTDTGLRLLDDQMPRERWEAVGVMLGRARTITNFAIGDWLNFGEAIYGETYAQGMHVTGLSYDTLVRYASVCRNVLPNRRRPELTFSHHAEVAYLPPADQKKWLGRAVREKLSSAELRSLLREQRALDGDTSGGASGSENGNGVVDFPLLDAARELCDQAVESEVLGFMLVPVPVFRKLARAIGQD